VEDEGITSYRTWGGNDLPFREKLRSTTGDKWFIWDVINGFGSGKC